MERILPVVYGASGRSVYSDVAAIPSHNPPGHPWRIPPGYGGSTPNEHVRFRRGGFKSTHLSKKLPRAPQRSSPRPRTAMERESSNKRVSDNVRPIAGRGCVTQILPKAWISWGTFKPFRLTGTANILTRGFKYTFCFGTLATAPTRTTG